MGDTRSLDSSSNVDNSCGKNKVPHFHTFAVVILIAEGTCGCGGSSSNSSPALAEVEKSSLLSS